MRWPDLYPTSLVDLLAGVAAWALYIGVDYFSMRDEIRRTLIRPFVYIVRR